MDIYVRNNNAEKLLNSESLIALLLLCYRNFYNFFDLTAVIVHLPSSVKYIFMCGLEFAYCFLNNFTCATCKVFY